MSRPPKAVRDYMAKIGAEGGKKGGAAKGKSKARSPEHYAKMVAARKAKRGQPVIQPPLRTEPNRTLSPRPRGQKR